MNSVCYRPKTSSNSIGYVFFIHVVVMSLSNIDILAQNLLLNFLKNISLENIHNGDHHNKHNDDYDYLVVDHHHHPYHHHQQGLQKSSRYTRNNFRSPQNYRHHTFFMQHTIPTASSFLISQPLTNATNQSQAAAASPSSSTTTATTFGSDYLDENNPLLFPDFIDSHENNENIFFDTGDQNVVDNVVGAEDSTIVEKLYLGHFIIAIILALIILTTVIGNLLVIAAILCERHLQTVGNYLVFSLAVADLLVACLVMPFGAIYVVTGKWTLGAYLCDLWTVADVLCCTASILHLLAIALDRFWAVTNVDYIHQRRNGRRIGLMILLIWLVSLIISVAPILGWRDIDFHERIQHKQCLVSQDVTYQIFATCSCFYLPLLLILILYWRIFQVARKRIRHKPGNKVSLVAMKNVANNNNNSSKRAGMGGSSGRSKNATPNIDNNNDPSNDSGGSGGGSGFKCQKDIPQTGGGGGAKGGFGSRFRRKLLKYSREEYLRPDEPERPLSDIVSHNVQDLQVDDSIGNDDFDDHDDHGEISAKSVTPVIINGRDSHHRTSVTTPTTKNVPNDHSSSSSSSSSSLVASNDRKKLSIISTNRTTTTTTYMTTISYESNNDLDNPNQNLNPNPNPNPESIANNNKKDHRTMIFTMNNHPECSIIAEEHSSSSQNSATQPLLLNGKCDDHRPEQQIVDIDDHHHHHHHRNSSSSITGKNLTPSTSAGENHCQDKFDNDHSRRINVIYHHYDDDDDHNQINNNNNNGNGKRMAVAMVDGGINDDNDDDDGGGANRKTNPINHNCANIDCRIVTPTTTPIANNNNKSCRINNNDNDNNDIIIGINESAAAATIRIRFDEHHDDDNDHNDHSTKYSFDNDRSLPRPPPSTANGNGQKCQQQRYFTNDCINQKNIINIDNNSSSTAILDHSDLGVDEDDVGVVDDNAPVININNHDDNVTTSGQPSSSAMTTMANNHHHHHHYIKSVGEVQSTGRGNNQQSQHQNLQQQQQQQKESVESKRERKAAKTLAIITGVFVCCWLPFFINALLSPLWKTYQELVPTFLTDFFLWLGYVNSCVNPIIYTIFSPDFRTAFKRMLLGKKRLRSSNKAAWSAKAARV